eukprot:1997299-Amphidinium_carterae.1
MPTFSPSRAYLRPFAPTLEQPMPTCVVLVGVVVFLLVVAPVDVAPLVDVVLTKRTTSKT